MPDATIVFNQTLYGGVVQNVTVWNNVRDPEPDLQELADALRASWAVDCSAHQVTDWSLDSITVIYNDADPVWSVDIPFTAGPLTGGSGASEAISQAALLVSTQFQGQPPNRGRIYFAGLNTGQITSTGRWPTLALTNFNDMVGIWAGGITTSTNQFFLRIGRRGVTGLIAVSSPVTTTIARANPATQRRRRLFQGI